MKYKWSLELTGINAWLKFFLKQTLMPPFFFPQFNYIFGTWRVLKTFAFMTALVSCQSLCGFDALLVFPGSLLLPPSKVIVGPNITDTSSQWLSLELMSFYMLVSLTFGYVTSGPLIDRLTRRNLAVGSGLAMAFVLFVMAMTFKNRDNITRGKIFFLNLPDGQMNAYPAIFVRVLASMT